MSHADDFSGRNLFLSDGGSMAKASESPWIGISSLVRASSGAAAKRLGVV
jgi:hypothetical protein